MPIQHDTDLLVPVKAVDQRDSCGDGGLAAAALPDRHPMGMAGAQHHIEDGGLVAVDQQGRLLRYSIAAGRIATVHQIGRHWQDMTLVAGPGDLTRDGRRDLVALRADGTLWAYPHQGNATLGTARQLAVGLTEVLSLA